MTLGDKLKQLRTDKNWTQPQAAEAIGIEQSYLSKLENDKSVPSAEIFSAILDAFALDAGKFLENLNLSQLDRQFLQIPIIATQLNNLKENRDHSIKKWLFSSAIALVLGLTCIASAHKGLLFSNNQFQYVSSGVVLAGESINIFENWEENLRPPALAPYTEEIYEAISHKKQEMTRRLAEDYVLLDNYRGARFNAVVDGGSRTYQLYSGFEDGKYLFPLKNRLLMLLGFLLAFGGATGFFVEYRLRKIS